MANPETLENPVKILLVDDREANLISLQSVLQDQGYVFRLARSGEEALRILLKETDFTLIILDVVMPGLDGFQTAEYIAQRDKLKDIPILFLTARDSGENVFKAYKLGAVDYISKPVVPDLLKAKVNVFVELTRKNRILEYQRNQLKEINEQLSTEIMEHKISEEKVKKLNDELSLKVEELESLDSFSYSVSHDLRNPLASITLLIEILSMNHKDKLGNEGFELITRAQSQLKRLEQIVKDLLLFSHYNSSIKRQEVDMNEVVKGALDEVKLLYSLNGRHSITIDMLPPAKCDAGLIRQVWSNLLSNAIKYSNRKEKPEIKIGASTIAGNTVFAISDNGIGFDPSESDRIFKAFSRAESAKKFEGNGIGLAIVKRIIDKHGGRIWAESSPGAGTSFYFTLTSN